MKNWEILILAASVYKNLNTFDFEPLHISYVPGTAGDFLSSICWLGSNTITDYRTRFRVEDTGRAFFAPNVHTPMPINKHWHNLPVDGSTDGNYTEVDIYNAKTLFNFSKKNKIGNSHFVIALNYNNSSTISKSFEKNKIITIDFNKTQIQTITKTANAKNKVKSREKFVPTPYNLTQAWQEIVQLYKEYKNILTINIVDIFTDLIKVLNLISEFSGIDIKPNQQLKKYQREYAHKNQEFIKEVINYA